MEPITPFEPMISSVIPEGDRWRFEIKWDGTRILTYDDGTETKLFNRKKNERTYHYPELVNIKDYCKAQSVILDGEVIALADGKPSFHEVMRRDLIKRLERVNEARLQVPITYMIFDILYLNGNWITSRPLFERLELLASIITTNEHVQVVSGHDHGRALFDAVVQQDMEGIVCKDLNSVYVIDGKDDRWLKVKNYGDIFAVVGGFTLGGGFVNSVLLGQYDAEGKLWYIGHSGTGKLTKADWRKLTDVLKPLTVKDRPFANKPERHPDAYWVNPELTVKVQYSEWRWKEGRALRQPSIQAFVEVPAKDCKLPWV